MRVMSGVLRQTKSKPKDVFSIKSNTGIGIKVSPRYGLKYDTFVKEDLPEVKPVQGIMPDSKEEYWVALALYKLRIEFVFQYQVMGGRGTRAGQIIDFLVYTVPLPTMVLVQGYYFHYGTSSKTAATRLNIEILKRKYSGIFDGPVELMDTEMLNPDQAYIVTKRKLKL